VDTDRIKGRVKEGAGKATGDKELEREGEAQVAWGDAKDKARDSWDKARMRPTTPRSRSTSGSDGRAT
jgi:uncharacterized protein YjbJ (UPF0337 family)